MQKLSILFFLSTMCCFNYSADINKDNLFEFLNSKQYITAQFIQTTETDFKERTVGGEIKANRSGQFKIEYKEPINEMISTDGEYLYKLDLELDQLDILPREDYFTNTPTDEFFWNKIYDYQIKFNIRRVAMSKSILTIVILFVLTACDIPFIPGI